MSEGVLKVKREKTKSDFFELLSNGMVRANLLKSSIFRLKSTRNFNSLSSSSIWLTTRSRCSPIVGRDVKIEGQLVNSTSTSTPSSDPDEFRPRTKFPLPTSVPSWYAGHMHRAIQSMPTLLLRHPPPLVIEARDSRLPITSINPAFDRLLRHSNQLKSNALGKGKGKTKVEESERDRDDISWNWEKRRLVVYTKKDLVDPVIQQVSLVDSFFFPSVVSSSSSRRDCITGGSGDCRDGFLLRPTSHLHLSSSLLQPLVKAFAKHGDGQEIMFVDTRQDKDVKRVINWIKGR